MSPLKTVPASSPRGGQALGPPTELRRPALHGKKINLVLAPAGPPALVMMLMFKGAIKVKPLELEAFYNPLSPKPGPGLPRFLGGVRSGQGPKN